MIFVSVKNTVFLSILVVSIPLPTSNLWVFEEFVSPRSEALEDCTTLIVDH